MLGSVNLPIVIHHLVKTVDNGHTNWGPPAWVDLQILQAYRVAALDDPSIDVPEGGACVSQVHESNLSKALSDGATLLADNLTDNSLNKVGRSAIEHYWGITTPADVASPADALIRVVGRDAHPDGVLGPRPWLPGSDGYFRWVVSIIKDPGRIPAISELPQLVTPRKFNPALNRDSSHFATCSHVQDVMMEGVGKAIRNGDIEVGQKMAGFNLVKLGVRRHEVADFASAVIPSEFAGLKPKPHETRYSSTFTAADGTTVAGFTEENTGWSIVSNKAENDTPGVDATGGLRWSSALSGFDHQVWGDVTWENVGSSYIGPAVRWNNSAFTNYSLIGAAVSTTDGLFRFISAVSTATLLNVAATFTAQTLSSYLRIDGSVLYGYIGAGYVLAFTDGTLTSDVYTGFVARSLASGLNHKLDNFVTEDFSGGGNAAARLIDGGMLS